ncbi:hypothetical protein KAR91_66985 [Candidatus Pacearchaeota archaeon]|nr:hypothetical protein [Candidatus Pacearchaeota archaeon]
MPNGIQLSVREYRELFIEQMPPWMELKDFDLLNYFSLSGHTHTEKMESIIIDDIEYIRNEWTLGELKTELSIAGTGNYDNCTLDILELIDSDDEVWIYTNPNFIQIDALSVIQKKIDDRRDLVTTEMNPRLATVDGILPFWEAIFQSERLTISGQLETDAAYMARVVAELFDQSSSLIAIRQTFEKYGLTNFTLINSKEDPTHWNVRSAPNSVNLYLVAEDYDRISFLNQVFIDVSLAGMRMFILCPSQNNDVYGLNYGNASDSGDYSTPPPFTPA